MELRIPSERVTDQVEIRCQPLREATLPQNPKEAPRTAVPGEEVEEAILIVFVGVAGVDFCC